MWGSFRRGCRTAGKWRQYAEGMVRLEQTLRSMGAGKIYISAHASEDSQAFYKAVGCVEAKEINQAIAENEPYDCQMEYVI